MPTAPFHVDTERSAAPQGNGYVLCRVHGYNEHNNNFALTVIIASLTEEFPCAKTSPSR